MKFSALVLITCLSSLSIPSVLPAAGNQTQEHKTSVADVSVDLSVVQPISPLLFGHNVEYIGPGQGLCDSQTGQLRPDIAPFLRGLKPEILRFPGGTLSNFYHWADGIGPQARRGQGCPDWDPKHAPCIGMTLGTDEFFQFARAIGCPAVVFTVNVPTEKEIKDKPWMGTAPEAAAWVAYCNAMPENNTVLGTDAHGKDWGKAGDWAKKRVQNGHAEPYRVKYWELGNEIFTAFKNPADYAKTCREFSKAMKAVDPSIRIGVVGKDTEFHLEDSPWNQAVLKETKGYADFLIAHFYLPGIAGGTEDATRITLVSPDRFRRKLFSLNNEIKKCIGPGRDFGLGITEFSCNLRVDSETDPKRLSVIRSQQAAVYLADTLLAFQEAGVEFSNYWTLRGWQWSLIELDGNKILPQSAYFVYKLFADFWQENYCPSKVRCGTIDLDASRKAEFKQPTHPALVAGGSVSRGKDRVAVMLVNRALDNNTNVTVHLTGGNFVEGKWMFEVLAAKPSAVNTPQTPNALKLRRHPIQFLETQTIRCIMPPCSIGVLYWKNEKGSKP